MMVRLQSLWATLRAVPSRMAVALAAIPAAIVWLTLPSDLWLVRPDLVPWTCLWTAILLGLGGAPTGAGHHPRLTPITSSMGRLARRVTGALPTVLFTAFFEAGLGTGVIPGEVSATVLLTVLGGAMWLARDEGKTAWVPVVAGVRFRLFLLAFLAGATVLASSLLGLASRLGTIPIWVGGVWVATTGFAACGAIHSRPQDQDQHRADRLARGLSAGGLNHASVRRVLAILLPALALLLLHLLPTGALGPVALVLLLSFLVTVVWPWPTPAALGVLLHAIEPKSRISRQELAAVPKVDTSPPRGSLRFTPGETQPTELVLPWEVPVKGVLEGSDGYQVYLWPRWPEPADAHVLDAPRVGMANGRPNLSRIRLRSAGSDSTHTLADGDISSRRVSIYIPNRAAPQSEGARTTFAWEELGATSQLVELDATPRTFELVDGSVIVLSAGVATQLYRVEMCTARPVAAGPAQPRPWFQDYVKP